MLGTTAKNQRFLKLTQVLLTFVSVCAVADASRSDESSAERPGYHSGTEQRSDAERDRRFNDLARTERKRREDEQQANRRRIATGTFSAIANQNPELEEQAGIRFRLNTDSSFWASCRVSETGFAGAPLSRHKKQAVALDMPVACDLHPRARTA